MTTPYFINAPFHQSPRDNGYLTSHKEIKEKYDYVVPKGNIAEMCNNLCNHIAGLNNITPVVVGGDISTSYGSIVASSKKYKDDLIVLWISPYPMLDEYNIENHNICDSMVSLLIKEGYLNNTQILYYGLTDIDDNLDPVKDKSIKYLTYKKIQSMNKLSLTNIMKNFIGDKKIHVVLDSRSFSADLVKSVIPRLETGLNLNMIEDILLEFKNNLIELDISEFNPNIGTPRDVKISRETLRYLIVKLFNIKEKKINIFSEDSYFLIYRSIEQEDPHTDIGWFILRGTDNDVKEYLLSIIKEDEIISFEIQDQEIFITKTTIKEQLEKSYYTATTINDIALYPQEKKCMLFELVNQ